MTSNPISARFTIAAAGLLAAAAFALAAAPASAQPGTLDTTFGSGGAVLADLGATVTRSTVDDVQVQPDGKVVALQRDLVSDTSYLLRYLPDGKPDPSFGTGGVQSIASGLSPGALALQPDGKIIAAGTATPGYFLVLRFLPNGQLDTDFDGDSGNGNGIVTTQISAVGSSVGYAVAVDGKGRIVVAGTHNLLGKSYFAIARYQPDGKLDKTLNASGWRIDATSATDSVWSMATQDDGKIVVAGVTGLGSSNVDGVVARYDENGTVDGTFGSSGRSHIDIGTQDVAARVAMQSGQILVAVQSNSGDRVIRLTPDGKQDPSFSSAPVGLFVNSLAVSPGGKIVLGGDVNDHGIDACAIERRNPDGSPDQTLANGAPALSHAAPGTVCIVEAAVSAPDGKIVAGESTGDYPHERAAVARYLGDDPAVGTSGGQAPGSPPQTAPTSAPAAGPLTLTALTITNRRFEVKRAATPRIGRAQAARSTKRGTAFAFTLNRTASVSIRIDRIVKGRAARVAARLRRTARAGRSRVPFSGRIGRHVLRPGSYRATFTAIDATGHRSKPHSVRFRIVVK
jgi:uncharacterized delta-60 repeat protein